MLPPALSRCSLNTRSWAATEMPHPSSFMPLRSLFPHKETPLAEKVLAWRFLTMDFAETSLRGCFGWGQKGWEGNARKPDMLSALFFASLCPSPHADPSPARMRCMTTRRSSALSLALAVPQAASLEIEPHNILGMGVSEVYRPANPSYISGAWSKLETS